ncbi:lachrymatory-factor synthase-like [Prosopis cineraria]|uniref:lachrymatory-factor synthase-like n=1 Tax=Prosopis cineraria TaxID=364024 RepID=UPI00240EB3C7|nr:lachrymatory-factor synthase-like [Prosopis cineraria]
MEEADERKWKGKAKTEVRGHKAEKVWPLIADFCGLSKWFPTPTCIPVEGVSGQAGCVRFCAGFKTPVDQKDKQTVNWTKQKLLYIDPTNMTLRYTITESNVGFYSYVATWRVIDCGEGSEVEWEYEVEPAQGWTLQQLNSFASSGLQVMGLRMEADLTTVDQALRLSN